MEPERRFFGILWKSFTQVGGVPATVLGVVGVAALWVKVSETWGKGVAAALVPGLLIVTLFHAYYTAHRMILPPAPKVKKVIEPGGFYSGCRMVLVINSDPRFAIGTTVAVSRNLDGYEEPVGTGSVSRVQDSGDLQVRIDAVYVADFDFAQARDGKEKIVVHPHMSAAHIQLAMDQMSKNLAGNQTVIPAADQQKTQADNPQHKAGA